MRERQRRNHSADGRRPFHHPVLREPVLGRARKRSYRGGDVKLISLKYRGQEGFAIIAGCSVNMQIKRARYNADRQVGRKSSSGIVLHAFLAHLPISAPPPRSSFLSSSLSLSLCLLPSLAPFFPLAFSPRSLSRCLTSATGRKSFSGSGIFTSWLRRASIMRYSNPQYINNS